MKSQLPGYPSKVAHRSCQLVLQQLLDDTLNVMAAILVRNDGSAVVCASSNADQAERLGRLAKQLYALNEAMVTQAGLQTSPYLMVETASGRVLLISVPDAAEGLLLCVVTGPQAIPAHLLWCAQRCAHSIQNALSPP
ncbi:MAG: hypothetical protein GY949_23170 [Gammaproteobacteria bacterium]|nr:hypothetical protein [Gammaproteobacteria bacterium]